MGMVNDINTGREIFGSVYNLAEPMIRLFSP